MRQRPAVRIDFPTWEAVTKIIKAFLRIEFMPKSLFTSAVNVGPFDPIAVLDEIAFRWDIGAAAVDLEAPAAIIDKIVFDVVDLFDEMIHAVLGHGCRHDPRQQRFEHGAFLHEGDDRLDGWSSDRGAVAGPLGFD